MEKKSLNSANDSVPPQSPQLTDYDCLIHAEYEYILGKSQSLYEHEFPSEHIQLLKHIKNSEVKNRRYKKWYKMSYPQDESRILATIDFEEVSHSIWKFTSNQSNTTINLISYNSEIKHKNTFLSLFKVTPSPTVYSCNTEYGISITQSEVGLREYYTKHKTRFKERVIKGPPHVFRITAWMICANVPKDRSHCLYNEILKNEIDIETKNQINKDIQRTMQGEEIIDNYGNDININVGLFRLLKCIALLDFELSYCQGMNFICGFLLKITKGNEIDCFYLIVALFSHSFSDAYGIRGFYLDDFPLLQFYLYVFDIYFNKKIKKLYTKFKEVEIPQECWISKWLQTLYVHILPKEALLRVWDFMFSKGIIGLISIALSIVVTIEHKLIKVEDLTEVNDIFKEYFNSSGFDIEKVITIAKERFVISKKEMQKYKEEYVSKGNKVDEVMKYACFDKDYKESSDNEFMSYEMMSKMLKPCKKFKVREDVEDDDDECEDNTNINANNGVNDVNVCNNNNNVNDNEEIEDESKYYMVTDNGDGFISGRGSAHSVRKDWVQMKNPFLNNNNNNNSNNNNNN